MYTYIYIYIYTYIYIHIYIYIYICAQDGAEARGQEDRVGVHLGGLVGDIF